MQVRFDNVWIRGIAAAIPRTILELESLGALYGTDEVKRIIASTGIERVRVASDEHCTSDLCAISAEQLLMQLDVPPSTIDGVVFVSQTPDYILPATSTLLQHRLGLPTSAVAFDIHHGCSGYVYGLYQASMLLASGGCERVLVCAGDLSTRLVHPMDRSVRMVFGDGGSATLVEKGSGTAHFIIRTDGSGAEHLIIPAGGFRQPRTTQTSAAYTEDDGNVRSAETLRMNGMEIMSFALREIPPMMDDLLTRVGWKKEEVGTFAFHQANRFMLDYLRRKLKISKEIVPVAVDSVGNTGPASIPLMFSLLHSSLEERNQLQKVICCGFGVGLSWASCAVDLSTTTILDPVEL